MSLAEKYAYDKHNCQVFIRLLVELIGSQAVKVNFPHFLDQWLKGIGNTRDTGFLTFAAGASMIAASVAMMGVDGGSIAAAGFAIAVGTTLNGATFLLKTRRNQEEKIKLGQRQIRQEFINAGTPLA